VSEPNLLWQPCSFRIRSKLVGSKGHNLTTCHEDDAAEKLEDSAERGYLNSRSSASIGGGLCFLK
jgi:hypothetical protein